jgi:hypothetical protein
VASGWWITLTTAVFVRRNWPSSPGKPRLILWGSPHSALFRAHMTLRIPRWVGHANLFPSLHFAGIHQRSTSSSPFHCYNLYFYSVLMACGTCRSKKVKCMWVDPPTSFRPLIRPRPTGDLCRPICAYCKVRVHLFMVIEVLNQPLYLHASLFFFL